MKKYLHNYPTPFFVIDLPKLQEEIDLLKKSIEDYWPNTTIAYSVKTNALPFLAKYLFSQGLSAEVVSQDEYEMVSLCGFTDDKIVCNGPVKSEALVCKLLDKHTKINLDSHREVSYAIFHASNNPNNEYEIGLRINVNLEKKFPLEGKAGNQGSRFGFCTENDELKKIINQIQECSNLKIKGLHLHVSTISRSVEIYRFLTDLFASIVSQYNLKDISYFDIGGGFYGGLPSKPQWNDYLSVIKDELNLKGFSYKNIKLILEPGVSLLASSFSYYTSVIDVKDTSISRFVVTDGSRIHIDPLFHKNSYFYHLYNSKKQKRKLLRQIIVGFTCLEYDNIMTLNDSNEICVGDIFCFEKLGAYTLTLSPLFISYFPAVYAKDSDGNLRCVREKWTAKEFIQKSILD